MDNEVARKDNEAAGKEFEPSIMNNEVARKDFEHSRKKIEAARKEVGL